MTERNAGASNGDGDGQEPFDEEAAWAAIVAGYGKEPEMPGEDGRGPSADTGPERERDQEDRAPDGESAPKPETAEPEAGAEHGTGTGAVLTDPGSGADEGTGDGADPGANAGPGSTNSADRPLGSSITVYAAGIGPRDWSTKEPSEEDFDESDEGHFVPPEPPPLPKGDTTSRFAWLAVLGGPLLLLFMVLMRWEMRWWITVLGVGGFLGGFATLVARMKDDDEEDDDPGRGAVV